MNYYLTLPMATEWEVFLKRGWAFTRADTLDLSKLQPLLFHIGGEVGAWMLEAATHPSIDPRKIQQDLDTVVQFLEEQGLSPYCLPIHHEAPTVQDTRYEAKIRGLVTEWDGQYGRGEGRNIRDLIRREMSQNAALQITVGIQGLGGVENRQTQRLFYALFWLSEQLLAYLQPNLAKHRFGLYTWCTSVRSPHTPLSYRVVEGYLEFLEKLPVLLYERDGLWHPGPVASAGNGTRKTGGLYWPVRITGLEDGDGNATPNLARIEILTLGAMPPKDSVFAVCLVNELVLHLLSVRSLNDVPGIGEAAWRRCKETGRCNTDVWKLFQNLERQIPLEYREHRRPRIRA